MTLLQITINIKLQESDTVSPLSDGGKNMPKKTFFNLPIEKRKAMIQVLKNEFSRVPLSEASIANIVKEAQISRGSFYQYFEDKEDAYFYLLEKGLKETKEKFNLYLKESQGDLAAAFVSLFKEMLVGFRDEENVKFFRNTFLNMNHEIERTFTRQIEMNKNNFGIEHNIDFLKLNIAYEDENEVKRVINIFGIVTLQNLIEVFAKEIPYNEAIEEYLKDLNLLKKGLYK